MSNKMFQENIKHIDTKYMYCCVLSFS